jgi:hypothetical protein
MCVLYVYILICLHKTKNSYLKYSIIITATNSDARDSPYPVVAIILIGSMLSSDTFRFNLTSIWRRQNFESAFG